ncbi:LEAF RUST 10 DISEASE-RESISTANCE LOCUS RECEPTOR-LIKE PROTEIN KINASE-like 2.5 [Ananas comosus]|uniref:LEAF RUST 10 DISEASE-RESISTANCE LOCUS RECEPTOR-LIKE PROTEIN KINASE-like 2.5 n=1 Tax=Ananas comosus TaxID=4615 RepID=A0A6P5F312_ANACO|nr:LEAF RUST 10 DISEASE-RESISTANCE LOCUS RECEPTOR-LIKE PROTEIN KINASE-like 2.5 [Ananas comosus]
MDPCHLKVKKDAKMHCKNIKSTRATMRRSNRPVITREGNKKQHSIMVERLSLLRLSCLLLLLLLLTCVGVAEGRKNHVSCSSSCGHLHDIGYPFRLKSDPPGCGSPGYELLCDGGKPMLELGSAKYYVTDISYANQTISVVDPMFVDGDRYCLLPLQSPPPDFSELYRNVGEWGAFFVNCTRPVQNGWYQRVPCLSSNNSFVYIADDMFPSSVVSIGPSCAFLTNIPVLADQFTDQTTANISELLKEGFMLSWDVGPEPAFAVIRRYLEEAKSNFANVVNNKGRLSIPYALFESEDYFVHSMNKMFLNNHYFRYAVTVVVVIQIVQLLLVLWILGRFVFAPISLLTLIAYKLWSSHVSIDLVEKFLQDQQMLSPTRYSYTDIIAITGHFREKLGQGGFGSVFRGTLLSGQHVAIKMLGNSQFNGEDFINEVSTIGRIHHVNIVRLFGFCSEGSKRALVYEYMPKGSLDKYIFSARGTSNRPFSWDKLNEIALGVARGIDYLHRGCDMQILHFDIKPHNILLDQHFNPKVSDFGLAKLYPKDYNLVSVSAARGTIGYIAPELVSRNFGIVSDKSDVYSFGMLLLEMAGGRRNVDGMMENTSQVYYPSWIYDQLTKNNGMIEINNNIEIYEVERKLCKVGLWCIQMKSSNRPTMDKVVEMLEGDTDNLQMPPRPFFASSHPISARQSSMQSISIELSIISEQDDYSNSDQ